MPIINVSLPSDATTADVADYNVPIQTMLAIINGQLDDANIASLSGTKIVAGTIPDTAMNSASKQGWISGSTIPTSVTYLGQRSYQLVYAASIAAVRSVGFRNKYTRTVSAPTQVTQLSGTKYWSKATPNKFSFTDDFVIDVVINPSSYVLGTILSVYNGTSGFALRMNASGQIQLIGYNAGAANFSQILTNQSVILGKETRITAQLDMSSFTNTATTSYVMFDGVDVTGAVSRGGTNPVALVQAGNLNVGAENGGTNPFQGNISQAAVFNAKVTQTQMRTYHSQGYAGTETSLASAYSFNGVATDLNTTTPNDLTANNSAGYATGGTFGNHGVSATLEYGITTMISSDGLTETVQVPEGCTIPTSGGIAAQANSPSGTPYGFPKKRDSWRISHLSLTGSGAIAYGGVNIWTATGRGFTVPAGDWGIGWQGTTETDTSVAGQISTFWLMAQATPTNAVYNQELVGRYYTQASVTTALAAFFKTSSVSLAVATAYNLYAAFDAASGAVTWQIRGDQGRLELFADLSVL